MALTRETSDRTDRPDDGGRATARPPATPVPTPGHVTDSGGGR